MSNDFLLLAISHSYGERALNGERKVDVALKGDSFPENAGEGGMRRRVSRAEEGADRGYAKGDGRTAETGDLWLSQAQVHEQLLCSLELSDGAEVGVETPEFDFPVKGAVNGAVRGGLAMALRKSV